MEDEGVPHVTQEASNLTTTVTEDSSPSAGVVERKDNEEVEVTEERANEEVEVVEQPKKKKGKQDHSAYVDSIYQVALKTAACATEANKFLNEEVVSEEDVEISDESHCAKTSIEKMLKVAEHFNAMVSPADHRRFGYHGAANSVEGGVDLLLESKVGEQNGYDLIAYDTTNWARTLMNNKKTDTKMLVKRLILLRDQASRKVVPPGDSTVPKTVEVDKPSWSRRMWSYSYFMKVRELTGYFLANPNKEEAYDLKRKSVQQVFTAYKDNTAIEVGSSSDEEDRDGGHGEGGEETGGSGGPTAGGGRKVAGKGKKSKKSKGKKSKKKGGKRKRKSSGDESSGDDSQTGGPAGGERAGDRSGGGDRAGRLNDSEMAAVSLAEKILRYNRLIGEHDRVYRMTPQQVDRLSDKLLKTSSMEASLAELGRDAVELFGKEAELEEAEKAFDTQAVKKCTDIASGGVVELSRSGLTKNVLLGKWLTMSSAACKSRLSNREYKKEGLLRVATGMMMKQCLELHPLSEDDMREDVASLVVAALDNPPKNKRPAVETLADALSALEV